MGYGLWQSLNLGIPFARTLAHMGEELCYQAQKGMHPRNIFYAQIVTHVSLFSQFQNQLDTP